MYERVGSSVRTWYWVRRPCDRPSTGTSVVNIEVTSITTALESGLNAAIGNAWSTGSKLDTRTAIAMGNESAATLS